MKIRRMLFRSVTGFGLVCGCLLALHLARGAADGPAATVATAPVPAIIQKGFTQWAKNRDASWAFDTWKVGGLMEKDSKVSTLSHYFARYDLDFGNYKNFELISSKQISQNSVVIYLCINFDNAAMYGRFLVYHTDKDWVVQNMDFSPKPEALMPWLAFEGGSYSQ